MIQDFLAEHSTQLTYHGLFALSKNLQPGLHALFRNSHLSVLYKQDKPDGQGEGTLWTLVTDGNFFNEPDVVWESLEGALT